MNHDLKVKKILASVRDCKVKWVMLKDSNSKVTSIAAEELHAGLPFMAIKLYRREVGSSYVVFCIHIANDGKVSVISSYDLKNPNLLEMLWESAYSGAACELLEDDIRMDIEDALQCSLSSYLRMEEVRRQRYKKELLSAAMLGLAMWFLFCSCVAFVVKNYDEHTRWYASFLLYVVIILVLLYVFRQQIKTLKLIRASLRDYAAELRNVLAACESDNENVHMESEKQHVEK